MFSLCMYHQLRAMSTGMTATVKAVSRKRLMPTRAALTLVSRLELQCMILIVIAFRLRHR